MYRSVRDRQTHTSHKAASVNCAIKALKGMADEIKLMWKSMTDAVHDMQASETSYISDHSNTQTQTPPPTHPPPFFPPAIHTH